ncbi:glycosyltransferase family 2 protein [Pseudobutyrivibrio xylanivorans]|uniref:Glycosyltransferase involved in cell wall bisynthesis n=1 Tax=Pseudobutyrivibrio xylanivorans DSM 14809 TaxID=1123012 RepID=A0A1M6IG78_PSEXY|nr:glycosyltransferase [Pseudobutyrivibrio xylanivorans]SHJ33447.1 Glycosyltransferase involved in cell wall bisynthesis [Pseudobutyrivibrio xylanivorans DSM 14809]
MENGTQNKLISVIVPVYNAEKFLDYCISSIMKQTYQNFELILIDDGSKDSSGAICDEWYKKDSRVKVVHQSNSGVAATRNKGLDMAKGDYICFIDNDDFVKENYLETFIIAMNKTNSDIVMCDIASVKLSEAETPLDKVIQLDPKGCLSWLTNPISREYVIMVVLWNKMYKRNIFTDLRFEKGKFHEDEFMINNILRTVEKVTFVPLQNYVYRTNETSITGEKNKSALYHLEFVDAYIERIKIANELDEDGEKDFVLSLVKWIFIKLAQYYKDGNVNMQNAVKKKYAEVYAEYSHLLSDKQKAKYKMFTISPGLFCKTFIK